MANLANVPGIENVSEEFKQKVIQIAEDIETDPNFLMAIMSFESGHSFSPKKKNPLSGATGLIQFMPKTAQGLGTSIAALERMTAVEQLDVVAQHFRPFRGRLKTLEDAYMAVLFPKAIGKGSGFVLFKKGTTRYKQNRSLDANGDGLITVGEAAQRVRDGLGTESVAIETAMVLRKGMKNPEVESLQNELIDLGYMTLEEKNTGAGTFGPRTEKAVKEFQRDNLLTDNGVYDLATQAAIQQINEGVQFGSKGGVVRGLQERLVALKLLTPQQVATGPGTFGNKTRAALINFQLNNNLTPNGILTDTTYNVLHKVAPKSKVGPSGPHDEVDTILPERGDGFRTFMREPGGATQFGTANMINALVDLAKSWFLMHPDVPLQYGHISRKGGGPFLSSVNKGELAHQTHRNGRNVDIRPIRKDTVMSSTNINLSSYDPARTKELVLLMKQKHPGCTIFFNDPKLVSLGLTRRVKGHGDHLHFILP